MTQPNSSEPLREALLRTVRQLHAMGVATDRNGHRRGSHLHCLNRMCVEAVAALAQPESLDAAWKAAEAALPEGAFLLLSDDPRYTAEAERIHTKTEDGKWVGGFSYVEEADTPAAALLALAARLSKETPRLTTPYLRSAAQAVLDVLDGDNGHLLNAGMAALRAAQSEPLDADHAIERMARKHFEPRRHFFEDTTASGVCHECGEDVDQDFVRVPMHFTDGDG